MFPRVPECSTPPGAREAGLNPLPPRQMAAARLLLAGRGVGEVAAALGVERHSVTRWKRQPAFQAELARVAETLGPWPMAGGPRVAPPPNEPNRPPFGDVCAGV